MKRIHFHPFPLYDYNEHDFIFDNAFEDDDESSDDDEEYEENPFFLEVDVDENYVIEDDDDYGEVPDCLPPPIVVREISGAKKNMQLSDLASQIAQAFHLLSVGGKLWEYLPDEGYFRQILYNEAFLERVLPEEIRDKLGTRDLNEIISKLLRNPHLIKSFDDFSANPTLVNCKNGVVDFGGEDICLLPHQASYLFNYVINANYLEDFNVSAPTFDHFCQTSLDGNSIKRKLFLESTGYSLSDSIAGKCAFFMKGEPDSGKSIFGELLSRMSDHLFVSNVPLHQLSSRFNKAELFGKKVNFGGEIKASKMTDISTFKMITGGDRILAEYKGRDPFYFSPTCKLIFAGNALPGTTEADATKAFSN